MKIAQEERKREMSVGELRELLAKYSDDAPVVVDVSPVVTGSTGGDLWYAFEEVEFVPDTKDILVLLVTELMMG